MQDDKERKEIKAKRWSLKIAVIFTEIYSKFHPRDVKILCEKEKARRRRRRSRSATELIEYG